MATLGSSFNAVRARSHMLSSHSEPRLILTVEVVQSNQCSYMLYVQIALLALATAPSLRLQESDVG